MSTNFITPIQRERDAGHRIRAHCERIREAKPLTPQQENAAIRRWLRKHKPTQVPIGRSMYDEDLH